MRKLPDHLKKRVEDILFDKIANQLEGSNFFDFLYENNITKNRGVYLEESPSSAGKKLIYNQNLRVVLKSYNYDDKLSKEDRFHYDCPYIQWGMNILYTYPDKFNHKAKSTADNIHGPLQSIATCKLLIEKVGDSYEIQVSDLKVSVDRLTQWH